jgi:3-hydroxybutyryl-CoA dehydratase
MVNVRAPVKIGQTVEITVAGAEHFPERRRALLTYSWRAGMDVVRDGKAPGPQPAKDRLPPKL